MDRDEAEIDAYYHMLGTDRPIRNPADLAVFETRIKYEAKEGVSFHKIIEHFWQASRAASLIPTNNDFHNHPVTKEAHKFMARRLSGVHDLFLSGDHVANAVDLERMMATQVRLQTIPPSQFVLSWVDQSLVQMDELSDDWFKANFDHFTKLGVYPQDEFITAWWDQRHDRIHEFRPVDQFRILYRMAILDFLRSADSGDVYAGVPSPCRKVAEHIFAIIEPQAKTLFSQKINNQVFFAGLWFDKDFVRDIPLEGDDHSFASEFEKKVAKSIGSTSIRVNHNGMIVPVTGHKIDLRLVHGDQIFGCEVDGISHFNWIAGAKPSEHIVMYNASTRFHSALMARYMTDVNLLRVPYFLFDENEKGIPWEKALSRIGRKAGHGIYAWHGSSLASNMQTEKNAHIFRECQL